MKYEIKIWNDPSKVPNFKPEKADNLLDSVANAIRSTSGAGVDNNPDILIDQDAGGADAIQSIAISYVTKEVEVSSNVGLHVKGLIDNKRELTTTKKKVRVIKIDIKGNLYLPLEQEGLTDNAKKLVGVSTGYENKIRDTLLLSKWASVLPENDKKEHFYRGIVVSVITKAGDFRIITAKKVYVDSYSENYNEGEFGTFTLSLIEKVDSNDDFKVDGLGFEKMSAWDKVKGGVEKVAAGMAIAGTAVAAVGAVGKTVTETVEKFTGETTATKWIKYGMDTASNAGNVTNSVSNVMKNPKDVKTITEESKKVTKEVTDNVKNAKDKADMIIPLEDMEKAYLGQIKKDPKRYQKYLNMTEAEKREELEKAAEEIRNRGTITKEMEEETRDYYRRENANAENSTGNSDLNTLISDAATKKK